MEEYYGSKYSSFITRKDVGYDEIEEEFRKNYFETSHFLKPIKDLSKCSLKTRTREPKYFKCNQWRYPLSGSTRKPLKPKNNSINFLNPITHKTHLHSRSTQKHSKSVSTTPISLPQNPPHIPSKITNFLPQKKINKITKIFIDQEQKSLSASLNPHSPSNPSFCRRPGQGSCRRKSLGLGRVVAKRKNRVDRYLRNVMSQRYEELEKVKREEGREWMMLQEVLRRPDGLEHGYNPHRVKVPRIQYLRDKKVPKIGKILRESITKSVERSNFRIIN
ncbi:unnamed protein product [Moneuplotes crassus]|uniref:Uncharacterized protein n=1 Tax=Euplotes crassus TaxID=5936 RepID=A0AAD2CY07_EUPCR|nr:unnamed protein product [Moneuplotes crassus]